MPRVVLLVAIAIAVYIVVRRIQSMPPHKRKSAYLQFVLVGATGAAVLLTLAGKMHWVGAALGGLAVGFRQLLPVLIRAFPLLERLWQQRTAGGVNGRQSEVSSALLRMTLDHDSGELAGTVTGGPYTDWHLAEMSRDQLSELLAFCREQDADSVELLMGYLDQRFPEGFDETHGAGSGQSSDSAAGGMSRNEALSVLGLDEEATEEDIITAHRQLMQKLHPDRGGNDYLAAKVNEAKAFLLSN